MVLSELSIAEPKTKLLAKVLTHLGLTATTLIVLGEEGRCLSGRREIFRCEAGHPRNAQCIRCASLSSDPDSRACLITCARGLVMKRDPQDFSCPRC